MVHIKKNKSHVTQTDSGKPKLNLRSYLLIFERVNAHYMPGITPEAEIVMGMTGKSQFYGAEF